MRANRLRVVIDTNVVVSALLFGGGTGAFVQLWQENRIVWLASRGVLMEYVRVLSYPKFELSKEDIDYIFKNEIFPFVEPVKVRAKVNVIKDDIADNKFLALALNGKADMVISGDRHLLTLKSFHGISIIPPSEFLKSFVT